MYITDGEETQDSDSNGEEYSSDDEDSDDPDKLWCICQQPHDDRWYDLLLMIVWLLNDRDYYNNSCI